MKFSICIPNYNYARYLGPAIESILGQDHRDLEVVVSDNASTDGSVAAVEAIADPRVRVQVNACNVGFAGNLDRTVRMATGDRILLFPSDDLMHPGLLERYDRFYARLGAESESAVIGTAVDIIGSSGERTGEVPYYRHLWRDADRCADFDELFGGPVYRVAGTELLKRCLEIMANPYNLTTACYPRALYDQIEGYGSGRTINPDKWFHWRLLGAAGQAYYVDCNFASCRVHPANQNSQQSASGALKYLVDEYTSTFELDGRTLERLGMSRTDLEQKFIEFDIARHGLATLSSGDRVKAQRILRFGEAVYPRHTFRNRKAWALRALLASGPVGGTLSRLAYQVYSRVQNHTA